MVYKCCNLKVNKKYIRLIKWKTLISNKPIIRAMNRYLFRTIPLYSIVFPECKNREGRIQKEERMVCVRKNTIEGSRKIHSWNSANEKRPISIQWYVIIKYLRCNRCLIMLPVKQFRDILTVGIEMEWRKDLGRLTAQLAKYLANSPHRHYWSLSPNFSVLQRNIE